MVLGFRRIWAPLLQKSLLENFNFFVQCYIFFYQLFSLSIVLTLFHIVIEFMNTLKDLEDFNIFDLAKLQEFNKRITELIKNALNQNSNAYLILGKSSFPLTSFMTEVPIIVKPVHWLSEQINGLISIW